MKSCGKSARLRRVSDVRGKPYPVQGQVDPEINALRLAEGWVGRMNSSVMTDPDR